MRSLAYLSSLGMLLVCLHAEPAACAEDSALSWAQWQNARTLYDSGKYDEALQALRAAPTEDASYYYNLGSVHYRLGQLGAAVAYLEKANHTRAHDPDIQHNLQMARAGLGRLIGQERLDPASSWLESIADNAPLDEIRGTLGLVAFVLTVYWILLFRKTRSLRQTLLNPAGLLGILAFCITGGLYAAQRLADSNPPATCIEAQTVRSGPGDQYLELARMDAGSKLRLLGPTAQSGQDRWQQVRYSRDNIGWIRSSSLLPL